MATDTTTLDYPIGTIMAYAGTAGSIAGLASLGWLACDGSGLPISSSTYAALYAVIGSMYGADASSFYLPDYRGRFLRGVDAGRGLDPDAASRTPPNPSKSVQGNQGDNVGSLQPDQMLGHNHAYYEMSGGAQIQADQWGPSCVELDLVSTATGATGASDTRPKNIYVFYLIKYTNPTTA